MMTIETMEAKLTIPLDPPLKRLETTYGSDERQDLEWELKELAVEWLSDKIQLISKLRGSARADAIAELIYDFTNVEPHSRGFGRLDEEYPDTQPFNLPEPAELKEVS